MSYFDHHKYYDCDAPKELTMNKRFNDIPSKVIIKAIKDCKTLKDVLLRLGFNEKSSAVRAKLNQLIEQQNIDISHFSKHKSDVSWNKALVELAVQQSYSYSDVLIKLEMPVRSGNFNTLKRKIEQYQINTSHFNPLLSDGNKNRIKNGPVLLADILEGKHPTYSTNELRKRLIREHIKEHRCESCNNTKWMGQTIPLELNHRDGNSSNHVMINLELLCPNCHALTPTYKGRNNKRHS